MQTLSFIFFEANGRNLILTHTESVFLGKKREGRFLKSKEEKMEGGSP